MNPQTDSTRILSRAAAVPDVEALHTELAYVLSQVGVVRNRQQRALDTRLCRWDGQSEDYRKHEEDIGDEAKPFEGAPDFRVPVVDIITRERVALYVEALMNAEIQATPIGGIDEGEGATKMSRVLRWLRDNRMQRELRKEAELLANQIEGDDPGIGILKVWWKRELALELRDLSIDDVGQELLQVRGIQVPDLATASAQGFGGAVDDIGDMIFNPTREDEAVGALLQAFPTVQPKRLRKCLKELRKNGQTTLPVPYVKENRPCVAALRYMREIFFPSDLDDIQNARVVFEREWLTEAELRSRVHTHQWDENWVEQVIERGPGGGAQDGYSLGAMNTWAQVTGVVVHPGVLEINKLYEIWHAYARAADDFGIPGVYWTVFSWKFQDDYGYHELLDYPHGDYPFVDFRSEVILRGLENSRGTAARAGSLQADIKLQRDSRGAHTMLATVPPVRVAQRRGGLEQVLGPMVEVPVRQPDDVTWMTPPPFPNASIEMEKAAWNDLNSYFGRIVPGMPADLAQAILQNDTNRWLDGWKQAWAQIMQLWQEYGDPVTGQLVAGGAPMQFSPEEIRGRFTTTLAFSVRDLNIDFVIARNQAIAAVLQQDVGGIVDRTMIVKAGLRAIDPNLAQGAIRDAGVVTNQEIEDEQGCVNKMANGIEPPLRQTGINAQLRLDTLQKTVLGSPTLARRFQQPQTPDDELFQKLIQNRIKNLQFLVQQYQVNPMVGHQGTQALMASGQMGAGMMGQQ